jgi:hypothetical protein
VAALADKVGNNPVLLPLLNVLNSQRSSFCPAESATQEDRKCGVVALASETHTVRCQQQAFALLRSEPIADRNAHAFGALNAANGSSQVCTERATISSLISQSPDGSQSQI